MTNGITNKKDDEVGDCDWCEAKNVKIVNGTCIDCAARNAMTTPQVEKSSEVEVVPSDQPINERLKKAYQDKFNATAIGGMTHEEIKYKIADMQDMIKVLQVETQALMDIDDDWSKDLDKAKREKLREQDRAYRAKARPRVNSDGTLKISKASQPKPKEDVAEGNKAYESLVTKLMNTGKTREQAETLLKGMIKS